MLLSRGSGFMTPEAERILGKARGNYTTIESQYLRSRSKEIDEELARIFAREFLRLAPLPDNATVLVAGLGELAGYTRRPGGHVLLST